MKFLFGVFLAGFFANSYADILVPIGKLAEIKSHETFPNHVSDISGGGLTFSGNVSFGHDWLPIAELVCCSLKLRNNGNFTIAFDHPVNKVALDINLTLEPGYIIKAVGESTVSAVYKNSDGSFFGQSSATAGWIPLENFDWKWANTFDGKSSVFGVSSPAGFDEITFTVDAGTATYFRRFPIDGPTNLDSTVIYYSYLNPIPEPETYMLMMGGLGFMGWRARRKGLQKPQSLRSAPLISQAVNV
ncbi:MAG TPA: PEP-CTERM sorting domain-containing protein [Methylophilaceae bacterium]|nr:PEP-CTERM sorting domain-containing protein [Methylophilaceae bacterium]